MNLLTTYFCFDLDFIFVTKTFDNFPAKNMLFTLKCKVISLFPMGCLHLKCRSQLCFVVKLIISAGMTLMKTNVCVMPAGFSLVHVENDIVQLYVPVSAQC